jgi:hypothetical protein
MSTYQVLLFFHVTSVIVWLGAGTTVALLGAVGAPANIVELGRRLGPRVFAPASLGALGFGLALVEQGSWTFHPLWIKLGLAAFAASFALTVGVRIGRLPRLFAALQLLVLYGAVLDMIAKPS